MSERVGGVSLSGVTPRSCRRTPVAVREHATTRCGADHARASPRLQRCNHDLRGARRAFACQYHEWKLDLRQLRHAPQTSRVSLQLKRGTGTIRKPAEVNSIIEKQ